MRVLVIGGRGYVGSRVVKALEALPGCEAMVGRRKARPHGFVTLDLNDPTTFAAMDPFDFVVNCSDSIKAPPDDAIGYGLREGLIFLEASADLVTIDRALTATRGPGAAARDAAPRGVVILGIGLFPGLSNIMARAAHESQQGCRRLEIGVRLTSLAGSGPGTASLVRPMLECPAIRYELGQRVADPSIGGGIRMPFWQGEALTTQMGLPEAVMLHHSTGVPSTATYVANRPPMPGPLICLLATLVSRDSLLKRIVLTLMQWQFVAMRSVLLRAVREPIEITALADRRARVMFRTSDGFLAIGYVIAAAVAILSRRDRPAPGLYLPDELFELSEVVDAMQELSGGGLEISLRRDAT